MSRIPEDCDDDDRTAWSPSTEPLTQGDLGTYPVVVVQYWATWCPLDPEMDRRVSALRAQYAGRIWFRSCEADRPANKPFVKGVSVVPTLGCFADGAWFRCLAALRSERDIEQTLDQWLEVESPPGPGPEPSSPNDRFGFGRDSDRWDWRM